MNIPSIIWRIGEHSCENRKFIKKIVIPENVISIGSEAFRGCLHVEEIWLPKRIKEIGYNALKSNQGLGGGSFKYPPYMMDKYPSKVYVYREAEFPIKKLLNDINNENIFYI